MGIPLNQHKLEHFRAPHIIYIYICTYNQEINPAEVVRLLPSFIPGGLSCGTGDNLTRTDVVKGVDLWLTRGQDRLKYADSPGWCPFDSGKFKRTRGGRAVAQLDLIGRNQSRLKPKRSPYPAHLQLDLLLCAWCFNCCGHPDTIAILMGRRISQPSCPI